MVTPAVDIRRRARIVIPVYNAVLFTRICLFSLEEEQGPAEVVVVDNGSTDATPAVLERWAAGGPGRRFLRYDETLGFARACNAGAEACDREFIVFLNNDTFVLEGWLAGLLQPFDEDPRVQVTGSLLLYPTGHVQHAGVAFNEEEGPVHALAGIRGDTPYVRRRREVQAVTGAALAVRTAEFSRQGGFDTGYVNSFEDVDLCLKIKADGGRILYAPESVAYHFESMTEGRLGPTDLANARRFHRRWRGRFELDLAAVEAAAREAGADLEDRVPSRREIVDVFNKVLPDQVAELVRQRRLLQMRSVQAALWMRGLYRRLIP